MRDHQILIIYCLKRAKWEHYYIPVKALLLCVSLGFGELECDLQAPDAWAAQGCDHRQTRGWKGTMVERVH